MIMHVLVNMQLDWDLQSGVKMLEKTIKQKYHACEE